MRAKDNAQQAVFVGGSTRSGRGVENVALQENGVSRLLYRPALSGAERDRHQPAETPNKLK